MKKKRREMKMTYEKWLGEEVKNIGGRVVVKEGKEIEIKIKAEGVMTLMRYLRDSTNNQYKVLIDIIGVDWYERKTKRFEVKYEMLSVKYSRRIGVSVSVDDFEKIPTIVREYPVAEWLEREVYDMFGVEFENHPDLRRLLTDYGFEGNPLRKDFPLTGYVEVRYDEREKGVITEGLELTKERP